MKHKFLLAASFIMAGFIPPNIYDINVQSINGVSVSMNSFQGKKILVTVFNPAAPDIALLNFLNSLSVADTSLRVIAVPAKELGEAVNHGSLISLSQSFSSRFLMTSPVFVKKSSGDSQNGLFKWLTNVSENGHFDLDVATAGQMYIIGKAGTLYGVLASGVDPEILQQSLIQNIE